MNKNTVSVIPMGLVREEYGSGPGRHWFDADSMRFFRTQLPRNAYRGPGGIFFVSSEQFVGSQGADPRRYTVRQLVIDSDLGNTIQTVGEFNVIPTSDEATRAAKLYARYGVKGSELSSVNA